MTRPWFEADWPAPRGVRALSTLRGDPRSGASKAPYGCFNLGDHVGDDPAAVAENRRQLKVAAGLPSEPVWLSQVHGIEVADLDSPVAAQGRQSANTERSRPVRLEPGHRHRARSSSATRASSRRASSSS